MCKNMRIKRAKKALCCFNLVAGRVAESNIIIMKTLVEHAKKKHTLRLKVSLDGQVD